MQVNGIAIDQKIIDACIERMQENDFRSMDIEGICTRMGLDYKSGTAMRTADRIIQKERKAGRIALSHGRYWSWVR